MKKLFLLISLFLFSCLLWQGCSSTILVPGHYRMTRTEVRQVAAGRNLYSRQNGRVVRNRLSYSFANSKDCHLPFYHKQK